MPPRPKHALDIFLSPGETHFGDRDTCIRTLLGSCVSLVLWHPQRRIGGMCHYMLPHRGQPRRAGEEPDGRYADEALELLLAEIRDSGTHIQDYRAKVFGGGNMFPKIHHPAHGVAVRNIQAARQLVREHGLQVKATHLGGTGHRQVIFEVWSGQVWVKHLALSGQET